LSELGLKDLKIAGINPIRHAIIAMTFLLFPLPSLHAAKRVELKKIFYSLSFPSLRLAAERVDERSKVRVSQLYATYPPCK
jgi:hypothetical protein